ncbi:MAG: Lrp/AsnC ligand binding domain-containing protein [Candidatus Nitrosoabyssus spongiisocia]|nr:MAG: Lrp/AsnC ligand binding domain-containing protein [Nitrosopumilaceae archaeon AB1(1)]
MSISFVLLNSQLGSEKTIADEIDNILKSIDGITYEVQEVYGVYDLILKISSDNSELLESVITTKIRRIDNIQATLTMVVIDEQST